jgi:hypothetical protein
MNDQPKAKWEHNQRISPDNLRTGFEALADGIRRAIKEQEAELEKYQTVLRKLTKGAKR